jgi:hypothetical protein
MHKSQWFTHFNNHLAFYQGRFFKRKKSSKYFFISHAFLTIANLQWSNQVKRGDENGSKIKQARPNEKS